MSNTNTNLDNVIQQYIRSIVRDEINNADLGNGGDGDGDSNGGSDIDIDALADRVAERIEIEHPEQLSEERVRELISEHAPTPDPDPSGGVSEQRVIELIGEHASGGNGEGGGGLDTATRERLNKTLDRTNQSLTKVNSALSKKVGPETPPEQYHIYAGWGLNFTAQEPIKLGTTTMQAESTGTVTVELWEFNRDESTKGELQASQEIEFAEDEVQTPVEVNLDLAVPEGEWLLTRDWQDGTSDVDVNLARTEGYGGWEDDSDDSVTFHGSDHELYDSNQYWYYYYDMSVQPNSTGESATQAQTQSQGEPQPGEFPSDGGP